MLKIALFLSSFHEGVYDYDGELYNASSSPSGSSFTKCRKEVIKALKIDEPCKYSSCTFGGVWNGGGGAGQKTLYGASYFFDRPSDVSFNYTQQHRIRSTLFLILIIDHNHTYIYRWVS